MSTQELSDLREDMEALLRLSLRASPPDWRVIGGEVVIWAGDSDPFFVCNGRGRNDSMVSDDMMLIALARNLAPRLAEYFLSEYDLTPVTREKKEAVAAYIEEKYADAFAESYKTESEFAQTLLPFLALDETAEKLAGFFRLVELMDGC